MREQRSSLQNTSQPKPLTAAELGLAIASLVIGVLVAVAAVPAGILLAQKTTGLTLCALITFSAIALVLGILGRRNAMGIAGLILGLIALLETGAVFGYINYQANVERQRAIAQERERTLQLEAQRAIEELTLKRTEAELAQRMADATAREAEARLESDRYSEAQAKQEELRAKAQADQERLLQEENLIRKRVEEESKKALTQQEEAARIVARQEGLKLMDVLLREYHSALNDYQQVVVTIEHLRGIAKKSEQDILSLKTKLKQLNFIYEKLSDDDSQKRKMGDEKQSLEKQLRTKLQENFVPEVITHILKCDTAWRTTVKNIESISAEFASGSIQFKYEYAGRRLTQLHNALLGALQDFPEKKDDALVGSLVARCRACLPVAVAVDPPPSLPPPSRAAPSTIQENPEWTDAERRLFGRLARLGFGNDDFDTLRENWVIVRRGSDEQLAKLVGWNRTKAMGNTIMKRIGERGGDTNRLYREMCAEVLLNAPSYELQGLTEKFLKLENYRR